MNAPTTAVPLPSGIDVREPTGLVPPPFILLEGEEKAGKSYSCAVFTKSEKVGQCFWLDLNESAADEYGPIGNYHVIVHDGRWLTWFKQLQQIAAYAEQSSDAGEKPVVLIIDSLTAEWELLKDWIAGRASKSNSNKAALEKDPNAEIRIPNNLWNEANAKHRNLMRLLLSFKGIVIVTARGKETVKIVNGKPHPDGETKWTPETQKGVPYDVRQWVRMKRTGAELVGARSLYIGVRPDADGAGHNMPDEWADGGLEWFVFDALRYDADAIRGVQHVELNATDVDDGMLSPEVAKQRVRDGWNDESALKALYFQAQAEDALDTQLTGPNGDTTLNAILTDRIRFLIANAAENQSQAPATEPVAPAAEPEQPAAPVSREDDRHDDSPSGPPAWEDAPDEGSPEHEAETAPPAVEPVAERKAPEPGETKQQKLLRQAHEEAVFQAESVGIDLETWIEPMCTREGEFSVVKARKVLLGNRALVIEALREQGKATQADLYERKGEGFPVLVGDLFTETDTADRAEQGTKAAPPSEDAPFTM